MKRPEKKTKGEIDMDLPEELVINIIARLPSESIVRLKLVFREWKSLTESSLFRDIYRSNSTPSSWSVLHGDLRSISSTLKEVKLDLPRESRHGNSSFVKISTQNKDKIKEIRVVACTDGLVLLRLEPVDMRTRYYVGNPVLPQWILLPPPFVLHGSNPRSYNSFHDSGLVTRIHNGALLGYKVVRTHSESSHLDNWSLEFEIFSSDTGEWSFKQVSCPDLDVVIMFKASNPVSLNGKLYWIDGARRVIVHDFFSHDDQVRVTRLPTQMQGTVRRFPSRHDISEPGPPFPLDKMICTTSQGCYVYIDVKLIKEVKSYHVRVWRLNSDSWNWEKAWEINVACAGLGPSCVPMAVNCFDIEIMYLWDLDSKCFQVYNHRTGTKSCGSARKDLSDVYVSSFSHKGVILYKEDSFCFAPRSCISQFVPSFHIVPTRDPKKILK